MFKKNPDVSWRNIEGEAVLVHNRLGEIQVLNETGTYIWQNLDKSVEQLADEIADLYEISREAALLDVKEFVDQLMESDLISAGDR